MVPIDFLLAWIQNPDVDGHRVLANQLPFLFAPSARHFPMDATADLAREAALLLLDPTVSLPAATRAASPGGGAPARSAASPGRYGAVLEMALVVDDRTDASRDKDHAADGWREWLRISNALNLREQPTIITALTDVDAEAGTRPREATDRSGY